MSHILQRVTNRIERRAARLPCRLRVLDGPDAGLEVSIPEVGLVVGGDAAAGVVLRDPAVSGRHLAVAPGPHGFEVTDLGSRNGTFLDGVAIGKATVPAGALLAVGGSLLQLMPAEDAVDLPASEARSFGDMVGASPAMRAVYALLERASASDAVVLLGGESGTGKELAARAVHEHGRRRAGPFVTFDCGAATETLIESDLFGHVRGAFTGAAGDRPGAFARAAGGTLFLDEIGDLPLRLQPRLLRMLESGEVTPLGSGRSERHDVRVVAATHRDLAAEVERGAFRGDLYYRLAVVEVRLPPLRQRREDIPELVRLFLERAGAPTREVGGPNLERLLAYHWPGNVRELRNVIGRAVALGRPGAPFAQLPVLLRAPRATDPPTAADAAASPGGADRPFHEAKAQVVERFERGYLADLLARHGGNLAQAARVAGLERKYLYRLLDKHGLGRA